MIDDLVLVKGGHFIMGCNNNDAKDLAEEPEHEVFVSDYYISKFVVTVKDFKLFVEETGYESFAEKNIWKYTRWENKFNRKINWRCNEIGEIRHDDELNFPVIHVNWVDAMEYCNWLSQKHNKTFRLPTEAEWEYAAKGGQFSNGYKYSGSNILAEVGWFKETGGIAPPFEDEIPYPLKKDNLIQPIGLKKANELGIFDMSGNVWEWCFDWYYEKFYSEYPKENPVKLDKGGTKSMRGGCWYNLPENCRNTSRACDGIHDLPDDCGFRVVQII